MTSIATSAMAHRPESMRREKPPRGVTQLGNVSAASFGRVSRERLDSAAELFHRLAVPGMDEEPLGGSLGNDGGDGATFDEDVIHDDQSQHDGAYVIM